MVRRLRDRPRVGRKPVFDGRGAEGVKSTPPLPAQPHDLVVLGVLPAHVGWSIAPRRCWTRSREGPSWLVLR